jgi:hypothetical protein
MKQVLKVFVHDVNHPVAKCPEKKENADERKGNSVAFTLRGAEHVEEFSHGETRYFVVDG